MEKPKLRILLHSIWYFLVALLVFFIIFFNFNITKYWWFIIPYLIICTFIGPIINKIAPKQKRSDDNGNN